MEEVFRTRLPSYRPPRSKGDKWKTLIWKKHSVLVISRSGRSKLLRSQGRTLCFRTHAEALPEL